MSDASDTNVVVVPCLDRIEGDWTRQNVMLLHQFQLNYYSFIIQKAFMERNQHSSGQKDRKSQINT